MTLHRLIVVLAAGSLLTRSVSAQQTESRWWAIAASVDVGSLSDEFSDCAVDPHSFAAFGGGVAALMRPSYGLIVAADLRASAIPPIYGCKLSLPAARQVGPNQYENWAPKQFPSGAPGLPMLRTALHVGYETPSPILRTMFGGGVIWSGGMTPFGTISIGSGSSGSRPRFVWNLEMGMCRRRVREEHTRFQLDSMTMTPLPPRVATYIDHPRWTNLQLGVEIPITAR